MNLDCNLLTTEVKPASAFDAGCSAKQTTHHLFNDIVHLMFIENCQSNSK